MLKLKNPRGISVEIHKDRFKSNSSDISYKIGTMKLAMQKLKNLKVDGNNLYAKVSYFTADYKKENNNTLESDVEMLTSLIISYYNMLVQIASFIDEETPKTDKLKNHGESSLDNRIENTKEGLSNQSKEDKI